MINTDYEQWYLQNLTNTQSVQQSKSVSRKAQPEQTATQPEQKTPRYDTFEQVDGFSDELRKRVSEKVSAAEKQPVNESADKASSETNRTDYIGELLKNAGSVKDETAFPQVEYTGAGAAAQNIGLIDLIASGKVELPEPKEEIKPVDRGENNAENVSAPKSAQNVTGASAAVPTSSAPQIKIDFTKYDDTDKVQELQPEARKPEQVQEKIDESATLNTSDELETKQSQVKVSPAQQQVIQAYQRIQSYTNPVNMSMSMAYGVA